MVSHVRYPQNDNFGVSARNAEHATGTLLCLCDDCTQEETPSHMNLLNSTAVRQKFFRKLCIFFPFFSTLLLLTFGPASLISPSPVTKVFFKTAFTNHHVTGAAARDSRRSISFGRRADDRQLDSDDYELGFINFGQQLTQCAATTRLSHIM